MRNRLTVAIGVLVVSSISCIFLSSAFAATDTTAAQPFTFSRESISKQGTWILGLSDFTTGLANNLMAAYPDKVEIASLVRDNADKLNELGHTMLDPNVRLSTPESIGGLGTALKLFSSSIELALTTQTQVSDGVATSLLRLAALNNSLATVGDNLLAIAENSQTSGGSIELVAYKEQIGTLIQLFTALQKLQKGTDPEQVITVELNSNQSTQHANTVRQVIVFDGSNSTDSAGTLDPVEGFLWDFGDGTFGHTAYTSHRYKTPNTYLVKLFVTGPSGFSMETTTVKIEPSYPVAIMTTDVGPAVGPHPDTLEVVVDTPVAFSAATSYDPEGSSSTLNASWDFGDGTTEETSIATETHHTFDEPGKYTVTLSVSNGTLTSTDAKTVTVLPPPPQAVIQLRTIGSTSWQPTEKDFWTDVFVEPVTVELSADQSLGAPIGTGTERSRITSYTWEFGDGTKLDQSPTDVRSGAVISHTYEETGTYILTLAITDDRNLTHTATKYIHLSPPNTPRADFTASPWKTLTTEDTLRLDGTASAAMQGTLTNYRWEITDHTGALETTKSQAKATHVFSAPGKYAVTLVVENSQSRSSPRITQEVLVTSHKPVADFEFSFDTDKPNLVTFDASASFDADREDTLVYSWDFNGDGTFDVERTPEQKLTRVIDTVGNNEVTLQVSDSFNVRDTTSKIVPINSTLAAEIETSADTSLIGSAPLSVSLIGRGYHNLSTGIDFNEVNYYAWDFGDGSAPSVRSNITKSRDTVDHQYLAAGEYVLSLTVRDRQNNSRTTEKKVYVGNGVDPIAVMKISATPPESNTTTTAFVFDASASVTSRNNNTNLTYSWDFGDGSPIESGITAEHTFPEVKAYQVTLSVRDELSKRIDQTIETIRITDQLPVVRFTPIPTTGTHPLKVIFDATDTVDPDGKILEYRWDFGDGVIERNAKSPKQPHIYQNKGTYSAILTITDEQGVKTTGNPAIIVVE